MKKGGEGGTFRTHKEPLANDICELLLISLKPCNLIKRSFKHHHAEKDPRRPKNIIILITLQWLHIEYPETMKTKEKLFIASVFSKRSMRIFQRPIRADRRPNDFLFNFVLNEIFRFVSFLFLMVKICLFVNKFMNEFSFANICDN